MLERQRGKYTQETHESLKAAASRYLHEAIQTHASQPQPCLQ